MFELQTDCDYFDLSNHPLLFTRDRKTIRGGLCPKAAKHRRCCSTKVPNFWWTKSWWALYQTLCLWSRLGGSIDVASGWSAKRQLVRHRGSSQGQRCGLLWHTPGPGADHVQRRHHYQAKDLSFPWLNGAGGFKGTSWIEIDVHQFQLGSWKACHWLFCKSL